MFTSAWLLARLWPTVLAFLGWVGNAYSEPIKAWVMNNQDLAGGIVTVLVLIANLLRSPKEVTEPAK